MSIWSFGLPRPQNRVLYYYANSEELNDKVILLSNTIKYSWLEVATYAAPLAPSIPRSKELIANHNRC